MKKKWMLKISTVVIIGVSVSMPAFADSTLGMQPMSQIVASGGSSCQFDKDRGLSTSTSDPKSSGTTDTTTAQ